MTIMKTYLLLFAALLFVSVAADAQFIDGQAADLALGQPDVNTVNNTISASQNGLVNPLSVAVDPTTGKIFVADASAYRVLRWPQDPVSGSDAEAVFGQADFVSGNPPVSLSNSNIDYPVTTIADRSGRLWVVDFLGNRVLRFDNASTITSGSAVANGVLGEPNYTDGGGGSDSTTLNSPYGAAIDASGNLYVADQSNNRVLRFNNAAALSPGAKANCVLGQPNFTSTVGGASSTLMNGPTGVAVDAAGTLYVLDAGNNRVLRFAIAASKLNGAAADGVIGQTSFTAHSAGTTRSTLRLVPSYYGGIAVDAGGRLYISDQGNNRVLMFVDASTITSGINNADSVLGQSGFFTKTAGTSASGLNGPAGIAVDNINGKLWVADAGNYRVLRYSADSSYIPLPVELTSFIAAVLGSKIELAWKTATEINNSGFEVQRSTVNNQQSTINNWTTIAFVQGHGTTNAPQNYSYTDASVSIGKYSVPFETDRQ